MTRERDLLIVRILQASFRDRIGVFSDTKELLENQLPEGVAPGSREHANFLFFLISQDHGTKSAALYDRAKRRYSTNPDHFDPTLVAARYSEESAQPIRETLSALGVRYPNNALRGWIKNSVRLTSQFHADARKLVAEYRSASESMKAIRSFYGFGPKTGGLLFRVFVGLGLGKPDHIDSVDFPTDIHDTRIAALTGIADIPADLTERDYGRFVRKAQHAWRSACDHEGIDWLQVDRALWILGSKGCSRERHADCPIREFCRLGMEVHT